MVAPDSTRDDQRAATSRDSLIREQKILLADDDDTFVHLAEYALAGIAARLDVANDGASALGQLLQNSYDVAVLDLSMPHTDGFRVLSYIRHLPALRNLPVVVVTSRDDVDAAQEVYNLGADLMLVKPIDWPVFPYQVSGVIQARNRMTTAS